MKHISSGKFVFTGELEPLKTTSLAEVIEVAKMLKDHVVAINITDNPTAFGFMNALVPSYLIQKEAGVEAVYQMTTRDRNRLALLSDLLAAGALGIKNILALTGDYTTVGDTPQAKPVFDLDSATFTYMLRRIIDEGVDLNGNKIENPPKFNIGIAASPNAEPFEPEILKVERKVRLGVDFIQIHCVYSLEQARRFLDASAYLKTPVLPGGAVNLSFDFGHFGKLLNFRLMPSEDEGLGVKNGILSIASLIKPCNQSDNPFIKNKPETRLFPEQTVSRGYKNLHPILNPSHDNPGFIF